jgi:DNA (cytosine-5)-methyltransferase 1
LRLSSAGRDLGGLEHATGDGWQQRRAEPSRGSVARGCMAGGLADAESLRECADKLGSDCGDGQLLARAEQGRNCGDDGADVEPQSAASPTDSFWSDADWLFCRDGKWRPVEPGTFPLAHGLPARVVRLRGYGNAIVPQAAAMFVTAFLGALDLRTPNWRDSGPAGHAGGGE